MTNSKHDGMGQTFRPDATDAAKGMQESSATKEPKGAGKGPLSTAAAARKFAKAEESSRVYYRNLQLTENLRRYLDEKRRKETMW